MNPNFATTLPLSSIITLGFLAVAAIYIIFSIVLYYHWQEYSIDNKITKLTLTLYFSTTLPLLLILGLVTLFI